MLHWRALQCGHWHEDRKLGIRCSPKVMFLCSFWWSGGQGQMSCPSTICCILSKGSLHSNVCGLNDQLINCTSYRGPNMYIPMIFCSLLVPSLWDVERAMLNIIAPEKPNDSNKILHQKETDHKIMNILHTQSVSIKVFFFLLNIVTLWSNLNFDNVCVPHQL